MFDHGSFCVDKSKLHRAWEKHYKDMGLSASKMLHKVHERVHKGKFPTK
jgi:hypothetical protein